MLVFGVAYQRTVIRAILARTWHVQLIATLATSIVLTNLAIIVFGTQPKEVPTVLSSRVLDVGGVRLVVAAAGRAGRRPRHLRGAALVRARTKTARRCGRCPRTARRARWWAWTCSRWRWRPSRSAALAAAAAALVSPLFNIFPDMGALLALKAFAAVIVGGFGYVNGAIAASFLIGITESLAGSYISYAYKDAFAFVFMIAVLLWRPQGLFGRRIGI